MTLLNLGWERQCLLGCSKWFDRHTPYEVRTHNVNSHDKDWHMRRLTLLANIIVRLWVCHGMK